MKYFLFVVLLMLSGITSAQQKIKLGLQVGANVASQSVKSADSYKHQNTLSLHAAGLIEKRFSRYFSLESGLALQGKGRHINTGDYADGISSSTVRMVYLEMPVNAVAKLPLSHSAKALVGGGPYLSVGLTGKQDYGSSSVRKRIFNGIAGADGYRSTDWGINLKTGIELKGISLLMQYGIGLQNIAPGPNKVVYDYMPGYEHLRPVIKNRVLSVGIGYSL